MCLAQLIKEQAAYVRRMGNYHRLLENCQPYNDFNREIISAMIAEYGCAYACTSMLNSTAEPLVKIEPQQEIPNFWCEFCVPHYSEELVALIQELRGGRSGNVPFDETINRIYDKVKELNGEVFIWL